MANSTYQNLFGEVLVGFSPFQGNGPSFQRGSHGGGAVVYAQLVVDMDQVSLDGGGADVQRFADLFIAVPFGNEL
jgi:hypothetical protein